MLSKRVAIGLSTVLALSIASLSPSWADDDDDHGWSKKHWKRHKHDRDRVVYVQPRPVYAVPRPRVVYVEPEPAYVWYPPPRVAYYHPPGVSVTFNFD